MPPRAATVGRAVIGLAAMFVAGRNAGAGTARGCAIHSDNCNLMMSLRGSRSRAGMRFSFAENEIQRENEQ